MKLSTSLQERIERGLNTDLAFLEQLTPFQGVPTSSIVQHGVEVITDHKLPSWILEKYLIRFGSDDPWDIAHNNMKLTYSELQRSKAEREEQGSLVRTSESEQTLKAQFFIYQNKASTLKDPWICGYDLAMSTAGFFGSDRRNKEIKLLQKDYLSPERTASFHENTLRSLLADPSSLMASLEGPAAKEILDSIVENSSSPLLKETALQARNTRAVINALSAQTDASLEAIARTLLNSGVSSMHPTDFLAVGDEYSTPKKFYDSQNVPDHLRVIHQDLQNSALFMSADERKTKMALWTMYWMQHSHASQSLLSGIKEDMKRALALPDDHPYLVGINKPKIRGIEDSLSKGAPSLLEVAEVESRFDTRKFRENIFDDVGNAFLADLESVIDAYDSLLPLTGVVPRDFVQEQESTYDRNDFRAIANLLKLSRADGIPVRSLRAVTSNKGENWARTAVKAFRYQQLHDAFENAPSTSSVRFTGLPEKKDLSLSEDADPIIPLEQALSRLEENDNLADSTKLIAEYGLFHKDDFSPLRLKNISLWQPISQYKNALDKAKGFARLPFVQGDPTPQSKAWLTVSEQEALYNVVLAASSIDSKYFEEKNSSFDFVRAIAKAEKLEERVRYDSGMSVLSACIVPTWSVKESIPHTSVLYYPPDDLQSLLANYHLLDENNAGSKRLVDGVKTLTDNINQRLLDAAGISFPSPEDKRALEQISYNGIIHKDLEKDIVGALDSLPLAVRLYAGTTNPAPKLKDFARKNNMSFDWGRKQYFFIVPADQEDVVKSEIQSHMKNTKVNFYTQEIDL